MFAGFKVASLLPEIGMTIVQLTANLRIWYDRYTAEIAASPQKTLAEKEAEEVVLNESRLHDVKSILSLSNLGKTPCPNCAGSLQK